MDDHVNLIKLIKKDVHPNFIVVNLSYDIIFIIIIIINPIIYILFGLNYK